MGITVPNPNGTFLRTIVQQQRMLQALGQQQQYTVSESNGVPVLNFGLLPGSSPARYGQQLMGANGAALMETGQLPDGTYGLLVYDAASNKRVQLGELPSGDYGIEIFDTSGNSIELNPFVSDYISTADTLALSAATWTAFPTPGPSVTVDVGSSGRLLVEYTVASEGPYGGFPSGTLLATNYGVSLDGAAPDAPSQTGSEWHENGGTDYIGWSYEETGLAPGIHTLTMQYVSDYGGSPPAAVTRSRLLKATPL